MSLRPYQVTAVDQIRAHFQAGRRRVLLVLPTGSGKTRIFCHIMKETARKLNSCAMIVNGIDLVDQASRRLFESDVDHGVMQGDHWNRRDNALVQVCSMATLRARTTTPPAKLLVLDEAHQFTSEKSRAFLKNYHTNDTFMLSVTATPWVKGGLRFLADEVVEVISMDELIRLNFLVPAVYFAPSTPDLSGVKVKNGEYDESEVYDRMKIITGDLVKHWLDYSKGRPTLAFAVNVKHSQFIAELFCRAGVPAIHIDATTPQSIRREAIHQLETGEIKIISNCGILCTGVDIPRVSCILLAKPTKSLNLYIQIVGRGTRIFEGKKDFIVLDHAGNSLEHGLISDPRNISLDGLVHDARPSKICKTCKKIYHSTNCPACFPNAVGGLEIEDVPDRNLDPVHVGGNLVKIKGDVDQRAWDKGIELHKQAKKFGRKDGWVFYTLKEQYGHEIANWVCREQRKKHPQTLLIEPGK